MVIRIWRVASLLPLYRCSCTLLANIRNHIKNRKGIRTFRFPVHKSRFVAQKQVEKLQMLYDSLAQEYFGD